MLTQQGTVVPEAASTVPEDRPAPASRRRIPAFVTEPWFLPLLLAAVLGLWRCTSIVLWWDELSTLDIARRPVAGIFATAQHVDAVHSLYYLLMHFWMKLFGSSVLAVRLPSVLAMCGSTVCTAALARRLFDRRVAITASFIFALIPGVDRYASETRSYALVVLGSALALLALFRALERPTTRCWVLYAALVAFTGALNLVALIALSTHLVVVLVSRPSGRRRALKAFGIAAAAAIAVLTPVIVYGILEAGAQLNHLPRASYSSLPSIWEQAGCSGVFSLIVLLAIPLLLEHRRRTSAIAVLSAAVLPVLLLWIVSVNSMGFSYFSRYLLFVLPAWAIAVAAAVDRFKGVPAVAFVAVVLATALAVTHDQIVLHGTLSHFEFDYPGPSTSAEDYPAAAAVIEANYRPGDAASFAVAPHLQLGIDYYLPGDEQLRDVFEQRTTAQTDSLLPENCTNMVACIEKAPDRVWLVESGDVLSSSTEQVDRAFILDYLYQRVQIWQVSGITLTLLERTAPR